MPASGDASVGSGTALFNKHGTVFARSVAQLRRTIAICACAVASLAAGCGGSQPFAGVPFSQPATLKRNAGAVASTASPPYLYVANDTFGHQDPGGEVDILDPADPRKGVVDRITKGVFGPDGIFVDSHGTLYVTTGRSSGNRGVEAYKLGAHEPFRTYVGAFCAFDVIAADDGTVYIADACGGSGVDGRVLVYPPGRSKPSRSIYPDGPPYCLTLDAQNNLYVGYNYYLSGGRFVGQVERFRPGATHGVKLLIPKTVYFVSDIAIDKHGALLVADSGGGTINVYAAKDQPPSRVIRTGQGHPFMFAFDRSESRIYVSYPCEPGGGARPLSSSSCGQRANTVVALDYATGKRLWTVSVNMGRSVTWLPFGVAVYPPAPFGNPQKPGTTSYARIYNFKGIPDGASPIGDLVSANGAFYGSTYYGGSYGAGTIFRLTPSGQERRLYSFYLVRQKEDFANPLHIAILRGAIYGATVRGGAYEEGTVYRMTTDGKKARIIYSLGKGADARVPYSGLLAYKGALYGEAGGGKYGCGSVFRVTPDGKERLIYSLNSETGCAPTGGLIAMNGTLYGTALNGGAYDGGTVFSLTTTGSLTVLHSFGASGDGNSPDSGVTALGGVLYGTTTAGGSDEAGTLFSLDTSGDERILHDFGAGSDGTSPQGGLAVGGGVLYGTTQSGGTYNGGTLFSMTSSGTEAILHDFGHSSDGAGPSGGLSLLQGMLYGTTAHGGNVCSGSGCGTVFRW
jgi:uncharacterized repeat protein (TIGR03803 family)